jgi:hypothetical protein
MKRLLTVLIALVLLCACAPVETPLQASARAVERPQYYYFVDRVLNTADYAKLASWGVNIAVVNVYTNGTTTDWAKIYNAASAANINIVIWPNIGSDNACGWESPFNYRGDDRLTNVKSLLDWWKDRAQGIVIAHEPAWHNCYDKIADMQQVASQIRAYAPGLEIWNYIDNLTDIKSISDYATATQNGPLDYSTFMDVAVTWQHCAGNSEGTCSYAQNKITADANLAASQNIKLVYIIQTFTQSGGYSVKFNLQELETWSCNYIRLGVLKGFGYYTWDAGWWPDLHSWTDLHPAVSYTWQNCVNAGPTPTFELPASPTVTASLTPIPNTPTATGVVVPTTPVPPTSTPVPPTPTATVQLGLPAPMIESPINGAHTNVHKPIFDWSPVVGATTYDIQLSYYSDFHYVAYGTTVSVSNYQPPYNLNHRTYYWRVRASSGEWSPTFTLVITY